MEEFILNAFCVLAYLSVGLLLEPRFVRFQERMNADFGLYDEPASPMFTWFLMLTWPTWIPIWVFAKLDVISERWTERERVRRREAKNAERLAKKERDLKAMRDSVKAKYGVDLDTDIKD